LEMVRNIKFVKVWYNGGNWVVFIIVWFIFSALMYAAEHTKDNIEITEDVIHQHDVTVVSDLVNNQKKYLENQTELQSQMEKLVNIMQDPQMPNLFGKLNIEMAIMQPEIMNVIIKICKEEFVRIKSELDDMETEEMELADELIEYFSDNLTVSAFSMAGKAQMTEYLGNFSIPESHLSTDGLQSDEYPFEYEEAEGMEGYGEALHLTSTIFMNTGFGWKTPMTAGGKILTVLIIVIQLPFYVHCLATLAGKINRRLDRFFSYSEFLDDDEEGMSVDTKHLSKAKNIIVLKGCAILGVILFVQTAISTIYHYATIIDDLTFGDILYFEFVRLSAVAFGDILPEEELTLAGAILKNILLNIPSQITVFTIFIRILPLLS